MFLVSVPRIFKIAWRMSLIESPHSNVTGKTSAFYNSFGNFVKCIGMFQKVALPLISRKSILTRLASLQSTGCNTTRNKLLAKFLKGISNISENIHEGLCNRAPF